MSHHLLENCGRDLSQVEWEAWGDFFARIGRDLSLESPEQWERFAEFSALCLWSFDIGAVPFKRAE